MTSAARAEIPTWIALGFCYGLFGLITLNIDAAPYALGYVALVFVLALHSSLQHEIIHGHPTRWPLVNEALVFLPLTLSFPYRRYRDTHLSHHQDARLTDPYDDPESWYLDPAVWIHLPRWMRGLLIFNNCAVGRMIVGPGLGFVRFVAADLRLMREGRTDVSVAWALHVLGAVPVIAWLVYADVSLIGYGLACYAGLSLINLRSFLEHRAEERVRNRSAIVEDGGLFSFIFLNNNLHAVHHAHPETPWADLPKLYREHRDRFLDMNGGYFFPSYWSVLARHGLKPKEPPAHPLMRYPAE